MNTNTYVMTVCQVKQRLVTLQSRWCSVHQSKNVQTKTILEWYERRFGNAKSAPPAQRLAYRLLKILTELRFSRTLRNWFIYKHYLCDRNDGRHLFSLSDQTRTKHFSIQTGVWSVVELNAMFQAGEHTLHRVRSLMGAVVCQVTDGVRLLRADPSLSRAHEKKFWLG
jgi:hypothetical protein